MELNYNLQELIKINKNNSLIYLQNNYINYDLYIYIIDIINKYKDIYEYQKIIFNNLNNIRNMKNIPNYNIYQNDEPNFIILTSGQSNAGGWTTIYDQNVEIDQPNSNIKAYDINKKSWVLANLDNGSLGSYEQCRKPNQNLFAFQYAQNLIKNNPSIKPGIICVTCGAKPISNWVFYDENSPYYEENLKSSIRSERPVGYFFDKLKNTYNEAMLQLSTFKSKKIDVVIWHQGESDVVYNSNLDYYNESLNVLIDQFTELSENKVVPFIGGTILKNDLPTYNTNNINDIIRNTDRKRLYNYAELSELPINDYIHFNTEATRKGGVLYYEAYKNLVDKLSNEGIKVN
jgi:hypothetical protein